MSRKKRLLRLLLLSAQDKPGCINIVYLLDIWEKDGFDAAVKAWEKLYESEIGQESRKEKTLAKDSLCKECGIDNTATQGFIDLDCNCSDVPFNDCGYIKIVE